MNKEPDILYQLYYGNIRPCEERYPQDPQFQGELTKFLEMKKTLSAQLSGSQNRCLDALLRQRYQYFHFELAEAFASGYRLGVQLTTAALDQREE